MVRGGSSTFGTSLAPTSPAPSVANQLRRSELPIHVFVWERLLLGGASGRASSGAHTCSGRGPHGYQPAKSPCRGSAGKRDPPREQTQGATARGCIARG